MERFIVAVGDPDQEYLEMLLRFVRSSEFSASVTIKAFSNVEHLQAHMASQPAPHVLLLAPEFAADGASWASQSMVILLASSHYAKEAEERPSLFKFQPLHQLLGKMKAMYLDKHAVVVEKAGSGGAAKIVAFYSVVGGCGKTTAAVNLGRQLAIAGNKALYISLETVSASEVWFGTAPGQEFSEILYYVKTNPKQAAAKLEQYKKRDADSGLFYLEPLTHLKEIEDVSRDDVLGLLDIVASSCDYDYIIVDCDSGFHQRTLAALEASHEIIVLVLDDAQCIHKTQTGLASLKKGSESLFQGLAPKLRAVVNKYMGSLANEADSELLDIQGYLPYVPQWKQAAQGEQLSGSQPFNQQALGLVSLFAQVN